jgi:hypothetical protein
LAVWSLHNSEISGYNIKSYLYALDILPWSVKMKFPSFGGGKKYKCDSCGQKFKMESELEDHRRKAHPNETP